MQHDTADDRYIAEARKDPAVARERASRLSSLAFHLWAMTREERAAVTVEGLRETKKLLHGYITDSEIQAVIDAENGRVHRDPLQGLAA